MSINFISQTQQKREIISATKTLFVFNPEHDLALAIGEGPYTPPGEVLKLRKEKSLLPALYADNGDLILVRDFDSPSDLMSLPYYKEALEKNIKFIFLKQRESYHGLIKRIIPWGWDHSICRTLTGIGISSHLIPSEEEIKDIRNLSHRRTVIPFRKYISEILGEEAINLPKELFSKEEVEFFLEKCPITFLKAPWSSSGRGIIVSDHITKKGLLEWCHGIIKKQGSVLAEKAWDKILDFATEWHISNGKPYFMGYSIFQTSSRGKYHGNIEAPSSLLLKRIKNIVPSYNDRIIYAQQSAIENFISPYYEGYLGIDMLADSRGKINPCVELNLRLTMGHIPLLKTT